MDEFSEIVWDQILIECKFFNYYDKDQLFLFNSKKDFISVIIIKCLNEKINIQTKEGWKWLLKNLKETNVSIDQSPRKYPEERNTFIYKYLRKVAFMSDGKKYRSLETCFQFD